MIRVGLSLSLVLMTMTFCVGYKATNCHRRSTIYRIPSSMGILSEFVPHYNRPRFMLKLLAAQPESLNALLDSPPSQHRTGLIDASRITCSEDAVSAMRNLVKKQLRPSVPKQSQALVDAPSLASISETLCMFVPNMNAENISDIIWGMGTLVRNREGALAKISEDIQTNYRAVGRSISRDGEKERLRAALLTLLRVSITTFHEKAFSKDGDGLEKLKVSSVQLSKLFVGAGRMSGAGLTWTDISVADIHSAERILDLAHQASLQGYLSGSNGQPLSNVLWSLAQLRLRHKSLPASVQSSLAAAMYKECKDDTDFTDQALSTTLLSLAKMQVCWSDLPVPVQSALSTAICRVCLRDGEEEVSAQAAGNIVYSLGTMEAVRPQMTDRVNVALSIAIRKTARKGRLTNDDAVQVLRGLSLMRYDWTEEREPGRENSGRSADANDNALDPQTRLVLSNALYVSQTSVSSCMGMIGLLRLATTLQCLAGMGSTWASLDPPLKAAALLALSSADVVPALNPPLTTTTGDCVGDPRVAPGQGQSRRRATTRKSETKSKETGKGWANRERRRTLFAPNSDPHLAPEAAVWAIETAGYPPSSLCRGLSSTLYYLHRLGLQSLDNLPQAALSGLHGSLRTLASARHPVDNKHVLAGVDLSILLLSLGKLGFRFSSAPCTVTAPLMHASLSGLKEITDLLNNTSSALSALSEAMPSDSTSPPSAESSAPQISPQTLSNMVYGLGFLIDRDTTVAASPEAKQVREAAAEAVGAYMAASLSREKEREGEELPGKPHFELPFLEEMPRLLNAARHLEVRIPDVEKNFDRYRRGSVPKEAKAGIVDLSTMLWDSVYHILQTDVVEREGGRPADLRAAVVCIRSLVSLHSQPGGVSHPGDRSVKSADANAKSSSTTRAMDGADRAVITVARALAEGGGGLRDIATVSWSIAKLQVAPREAIYFLLSALQAYARGYAHEVEVATHGVTRAVSPQSVATAIYSLGHVLSTPWGDMSGASRGTLTSENLMKDGRRESGSDQHLALLTLVLAAARSPLLRPQELAMLLLGLKGASASPALSGRNQVEQEAIWIELYSAVAEAATAAFEGGGLTPVGTTDTGSQGGEDMCTSQGLVSILLGVEYLLRNAPSVRLESAANTIFCSPRMAATCTAQVARLLRGGTGNTYTKRLSEKSTPESGSSSFPLGMSGREAAVILRLMGPEGDGLGYLTHSHRELTTALKDRAWKGTGGTGDGSATVAAAPYNRLLAQLLVQAEGAQGAAPASRGKALVIDEGSHDGAPPAGSESRDYQDSDEGFSELRALERSFSERHARDTLKKSVESADGSDKGQEAGQWDEGNGCVQKQRKEGLASQVTSQDVHTAYAAFVKTTSEEPSLPSPGGNRKIVTSASELQSQHHQALRAHGLLTRWREDGLIFDALDKDAKRMLVLLSKSGCRSSSCAKSDSADLGDGAKGGVSRDLSGALLALTSLHYYGAHWSRLPTRPRNAFALALAEQTSAVTSRLNIILRERSLSNVDAEGALLVLREAGVTELVSQYLSLLFCLHRVGATMHITPLPLRSALGEGLFCLRKLESGLSATSASPDDAYKSVGDVGTGAAMEMCTKWRENAEGLLRQMSPPRGGKAATSSI